MQLRLEHRLGLGALPEFAGHVLAGCPIGFQGRLKGRSLAGDRFGQRVQSHAQGPQARGQLLGLSDRPRQLGDLSLALRALVLGARQLVLLGRQLGRDPEPLGLAGTLVRSLPPPLDHRFDPPLRLERLVALPDGRPHPRHRGFSLGLQGLEFSGQPLALGQGGGLLLGRGLGISK